MSLERGDLLNEIEAYRNAAECAVANSEIWLDIAKNALNKKYHGQGYTAAVIALEEIAKAVISFMVSRKYLHSKSELLKDAYSRHVIKGKIMLGLIFNPLFRRSLNMAREDWREHARSIIHIPTNKRVEKPQQLAKNLEFTRLMGVYVHVSEANGFFQVKSPSDFSFQMTKTMIQSVESVISTCKWMIEIHDQNPDGTRNWFEQVKMYFDYEISNAPTE